VGQRSVLDLQDHEQKQATGGWLSGARPWQARLTSLRHSVTHYCMPADMLQALLLCPEQLLVVS
jgi:hypothetical protein